MDLCQCLDIRGSADPVDLCLCKGHLSDKNSPFDVTSAVLEKLSAWWIRQVAGPFVSNADTDYEDLIARFCGPATTVRVFCVTPPPRHFRSEGQGVAETSHCFTRVMLHPHQLDILDRNLPLVWLCGPPGTGKTLVLLVRALDWMAHGWDVHVISTWSESRAASYLIVHQLRKTAGKTAQNVHLHEFDFSQHGQVQQALKTMVAAAKLGPLCVVADEVYTVSHPFTLFCKDLVSKVSRVRIWAASLYHGYRPPPLTEIPMTEPLRTPPVVTREVQRSHWLGRSVRKYTVTSAPPPCDGPAPRVLYHQGQGHDTRGPAECEQCGKDIAVVLEQLHVGVRGPSVLTKTGRTSTRSSTTISTPIPAPLAYRDVFLLLVGGDFHDDDVSSSGDVTRPASGVLRGLRRATRRFPVKVLSHSDKEAVRDIAVMSGPDAVVATNAHTIRGLERKVAVLVPKDQTETLVEDTLARLSAMSRTTAQIVRVLWPSD